jgi:hypothetical protein
LGNPLIQHEIDLHDECIATIDRPDKFDWLAMLVEGETRQIEDGSAIREAERPGNVV